MVKGCHNSPTPPCTVVNLKKIKFKLSRDFLVKVVSHSIKIHYKKSQNVIRSYIISDKVQYNCDLL